MLKIPNIKKVCYSPFVIMMHHSNFSFNHFSAAVSEIVISLGQFLSFTDNFMLESFEIFLKANLQPQSIVNLLLVD